MSGAHQRPVTRQQGAGTSCFLGHQVFISPTDVFGASIPQSLYCTSFTKVFTKGFTTTSHSYKKILKSVKSYHFRYFFGQRVTKYTGFFAKAIKKGSNTKLKARKLNESWSSYFAAGTKLHL